LRSVKWGLGAMLSGAVLLAAEEKQHSFRFVKQHAGMLPPGWKAEKTGEGQGCMWRVVADPTAPAKTGYVLAQVGRGPSKLFNVCVADASFSNVEVAVGVKAVNGETSQGG